MTESFIWYAVETQPHNEARAAAHLRNQGFEVYLPRYQKRRRHARRVDIVAAALFPKYLFVAKDEGGPRLGAIKSTIGVRRLVMHGDQPATLAGAVIDEIKAREDVNGFVRLQRGVTFAPGTEVRVRDGAFGACTAVFLDIADEDRVSVLMTLLGRKVTVVMRADAIVAA
jgi:transcriptional antiterminator RfaH